MRNLSHIVLGAFAIALRPPTAGQGIGFGAALNCVLWCVDFHLIAEYKTHIIETLRYLNPYLRDFHQYKDVFLEFRIYKTLKMAVKD